MNSKEFSVACKNEMKLQYKDYTDGSGSTAVSKLLLKLKLNSEQTGIANKLIETILIDTYYNLLLSLDGASCLGGVQQSYKLFDEKGKLVFQVGELEGDAYEAFQKNG
jgi:hypothetical protein